LASRGVLVSASSSPTTSGAAFFTASTTLAKLTCVPPYSMLNSMTLSRIGVADGEGDDADDPEPQAARAAAASSVSAAAATPRTRVRAGVARCMLAPPLLGPTACEVT